VLKNKSTVLQFAYTVKKIKKGERERRKIKEGNRVVRCRGSHGFYTTGTQMAYAQAACPLSPGIFLVLFLLETELTPGP
jgi:hypothetical protein